MSTVFETVAGLINKTGWFKKAAEATQTATQTVVETVTQS
jgi:hypothetical protein